MAHVTASAEGDGTRKCRWSCASCSFEYNHDWASECAQCSAPAPVSARRVGVKLRGEYFLCTLKDDVETKGGSGLAPREPLLLSLSILVAAVASDAFGCALSTPLSRNHHRNHRSPSGQACTAERLAQCV